MDAVESKKIYFDYLHEKQKQRVNEEIIDKLLNTSPEEFITPDIHFADKIEVEKFVDKLILLEALKPKGRTFCPKCKSDKVLKIVYGLPSKVLIEIANEGKVILGGCFGIGLNLHCTKCHHQWQDDRL